MSIELCHPDCPYLHPKEADQKRGETHHCYEHDERLFHGGFHPYLRAIENCKYPTINVKEYSYVERNH